jgi:YDG domain/Bacterial Ig-like domain (group 3)/MBG domain (YGX type)
LSSLAEAILLPSGLNASGASFYATSLNANGSFSQIVVEPAGELIASSSSFTLSQLYFLTTSVMKSGDLTGDTFNLPTYLPYGDVQYLGGNESFDLIGINGGTIPSGTLNLNEIGINTSNLSYQFYQGFIVASGATLNVGAGVSVQIAGGQSITDNGTLSFATGDSVNFGYVSEHTTAIYVNGVMNASGASFYATSLNANGSFSQIVVEPAGELIASSSSFTLSQLYFLTTSVMKSGDLTGDTFNLPTYLPYGDVQYLGGNESFDLIGINGGTIPSGTLNLNEIGINTSNLSYQFYQGFIVASGATLNVGAGVSVQIAGGQSITDNGTLSFATGDSVNFGYVSEHTTAIYVNGVMNASGASFYATSLNANGSFSQIVVEPAGELIASNSSFALSSLTLSDGSNAQLAVNSIANEFSINSGATISITGNNFTNISTTSGQGIVASGPSTAMINLTNNYWGSAPIPPRITDHTTNPNLPTVNYIPFQSTASPRGVVSATVAANASATFNSSSQPITLSATVTSGSTNINEGSETFTILSGINNIGTPVTVSVANGVATTSIYTLPAATAPGTYTILAIYYGTGNYLGSIDASHTLTINAATTTNVTASANPSTYGHSVKFTATVSDTSSSVPNGSVEFFDGPTDLGPGSALSGSGNSATSTFAISTLTAGTHSAIKAVYTPTGYFLGGSGSTSQTVNTAALTITANSTSKTYGNTLTFAGTEFTDSGLVNGDTVNSVTLTSAGAPASVQVTGSPYPIIPSAAVGSGLSNYTITYVNGTLTVTPKTLTASITAANKVYDGTTTATATNQPLSGVVNGDSVSLTGGIATFANKNVGTSKTVTDTGLSLTGTGAGNYQLASTTVTTTANITPLALTITAVANTKAYDATTAAAATPTITSGSLQGSDTANFTETYPSKNVGTNLVLTPSGTVNDGNNGNNYTYTFNTVSTGAITPAALTLTAVTNTKVYDGTTTAAAIPTVSGLKGSDTVTNLTETYASPNVGTGITLNVAATYTINDGNNGGNYAVSLVANNTGVITAPSATATFYGPDSTTEGSWIGVYGSQGYNVIDATNGADYPSYATVTPAGSSSYTWAANTNVVQALQNPSGSGRIAAAWYASTRFTVHVDLTDGLSHNLELYFLDYDTTSRSEQVVFTNAGTHAVLSTQTVSSFHDGVYMNYTISGNVLITITKTAGPNAVLSGLFFDPMATFTTTGVGSSANPSPYGQPVTFTATVSDTSGGVPTGSVTFYDGSTDLGHGSALGGSGNSATATLTTSTLTVGSHSIIAVYTPTGSFAGSSGILTQTVNAPPATATYNGQDTTTEGSWIGVYGSQGYNVINATNGVHYPAYATVTPAGNTPYTWAANTNALPALQNPSGSGRIAAAWYASTSFTVDVDLIDGLSHNLELYFLDYDTTSRSEQVVLSDANTHAVLSTQTVSSFHTGVYLSWTIAGNVLITITKQAGPNAVLSGLFFDSTTTGPAVVRAGDSIGGLLDATAVSSRPATDPIGTLDPPSAPRSSLSTTAVLSAYDAALSGSGISATSNPATDPLGTVDPSGYGPAALSLVAEPLNPNGKLVHDLALEQVSIGRRRMKDEG